MLRDVSAAVMIKRINSCRLGPRRTDVDADDDHWPPCDAENMNAENTTYIHELPEWPKFRWDDEALLANLSDVRHRQGRLIGRMEMLGFDLQAEASLNSLTEEVVKSSEIEGEVLDRDQVRSSLARRLGIEVAGLVPSDRDVDSVVEMMLDATENYASPLTKDRLFGWHAALFPTGRSGMTRIFVGEWRTEASGPMQVASGVYGHEKVHFEAPDATRLEGSVSRLVRAGTQ